MASNGGDKKEEDWGDAADAQEKTLVNKVRESVF